ncbi:MAG: hypothetical protein ABUT20_27950 [Bacteroidota bacterium]
MPNLSFFDDCILLNNDKGVQVCDACLPAGRQQVIIVAQLPGSKTAFIKQQLSNTFAAN